MDAEIIDYPTNGGRRGPSLPHAVNAERALLGAFMVNNEVLDNVSAFLKEEFFYDKRHKLTFSTMLRLFENGAFDPVLLAERLGAENNLSAVGGAEYIAELAAIGGAPVNAPAYAALVREMAQLRRMIETLNDSLNRSFNPGDDNPMKILDEVAAQLSDISTRFEHERRTVEEIKTFTRPYFDKMTDVINSGDFSRLLGATTGFSWLDKQTTGLHGGDLAILAGRPGSGKTAFALNLAKHISAKNGVIIFSLEMSAEQLATRLLSTYKLDMQLLRAGRADGRNLDAGDFSEAVSRLEKHKIYIDDSGLLNILEAKTRVRRLRNELKRRNEKLGLVVVDYLQLMTSAPGDKSDSRALEVSTISRGLKALAKELQVPVLALSQVNRNVDNRMSKKLFLSDLRESGAIEQDADLILFLYNEKDDGGQAAQTEDIALEIGKQRNGQVGKITVEFQKRYSLFREKDYEHRDNNTSATQDYGPEKF
ncbi:MAG: replicative DNA helicase [Candidatus Zeuxoniibacter abyssi]|nr:MAG: replicative DNA helicase [Candidatus Persebacteraceae bacterium AB1(2)]